jgi:hypothetical protein
MLQSISQEASYQRRRSSSSACHRVNSICKSQTWSAHLRRKSSLLSTSLFKSLILKTKRHGRKLMLKWLKFSKFMRSLNLTRLQLISFKAVSSCYQIQIRKLFPLLNFSNFICKLKMDSVHLSSQYSVLVEFQRHTLDCVKAVEVPSCKIPRLMKSCTMKMVR